MTIAATALSLRGTRAWRMSRVQALAVFLRSAQETHSLGVALAGIGCYSDSVLSGRVVRGW